MTDMVEVAIQKALVNRYTALVFSPSIQKAYPNVGSSDKRTFTPPTPAPGVLWLRASFLPAAPEALGISFASNNRHIGIFQVSVFGYQGDGEYVPGRIAATVIQWFKRGTRLTSDGFVVETGYGSQVPRRAPLVEDPPWVMIPVSIPFQSFATSE